MSRHSRGLRRAEDGPFRDDLARSIELLSSSRSAHKWRASMDHLIFDGRDEDSRLERMSIRSTADEHPTMSYHSITDCYNPLLTLRANIYYSVNRKVHVALPDCQVPFSILLETPRTPGQVKQPLPSSPRQRQRNDTGISSNASILGHAQEARQQGIAARTT